MSTFCYIFVVFLKVFAALLKNLAIYTSEELQTLCQIWQKKHSQYLFYSGKIVSILGFQRSF